MSDAAVVYVSWGVVVADCPRPDCLGAEHYGHAPVTGFVGGLTKAGFRCSRCGLVCLARWPVNSTDIWWVLNQRPLMETRNWRPPETLEDLLLENCAHGLIPAALESGPLYVIDGRLPDYALTSAGRSAIGGGSD